MDLIFNRFFVLASVALGTYAYYYYKRQREAQQLLALGASSSSSNVNANSVRSEKTTKVIVRSRTPPPSSSTSGRLKMRHRKRPRGSTPTKDGASKRRSPIRTARSSCETPIRSSDIHTGAEIEAIPPNTRGASPRTPDAPESGVRTANEIADAAESGVRTAGVIISEGDVKIARLVRSSVKNGQMLNESDVATARGLVNSPECGLSTAKEATAKTAPIITHKDSDVSTTKEHTARITLEDIQWNQLCICRVEKRGQQLPDNDSCFATNTIPDVGKTSTEINYNKFDASDLTEPIVNEKTAMLEMKLRPRQLRKEQSYLTAFQPILQSLEYANTHSLIVELLLENYAWIQ